MNDFYQEDLAYVHHVGFTEFAAQAGNEILKIYSGTGLTSGTVADLGCGSGIWAKQLLEAGFEVIGADISLEMLKIARQTAVQANFENTSAFDIELPPCVSVTALGEVLGYGSPGLPEMPKLKQLFHNVAKSLPAGGQFLFDVIVKSSGEPMNYQSWKKGKDWAVLTATEEQHDGDSLIREITVFRHVEGSYRRSEESHLVKIYETEELRELLSEAGFDVTVSSQYGNYQLAPRRIAFAAQRR
jgi:SAM-dependent methyltransferase